MGTRMHTLSIDKIMAIPKIDDQYWFDYSKELVDGAISRLDNAIDTLKIFISGLLAVYTGSAIFTIEYKEIENVSLLILFSVPYILVLFGNWYSTAAKIPKTVEFDYRVAEDIEKAYLQTYSLKQRNLRILARLAFVTTFFVALTLMLGFIIGNKNIATKKAVGEYYFDGNLDSSDNTLYLTGGFPPKSPLNMVTTITSSKDSILTKAEKFFNTRSGVFFHTIKLGRNYKKVAINIEWQEVDHFRSITKEFIIH